MKKSIEIPTPLLVGLSILVAGMVCMWGKTKHWTEQTMYPALIIAFFFPLVIGLLIQVSCLRSRVEALEELADKTAEAGDDPPKKDI